jgi:hypothetical protein
LIDDIQEPQGGKLIMKKKAKHSVTSSVIRSTFVLLTLAFVLSVTPFAPGQQKHRASNKTTLTSPSSLTGHQKKQPVQTTPDSIRNRRQATVSEPTNPRPALSVQGVSSGIDCNTAPGIVIHDDGTVESGYVGGPGIIGIFADKFTPAIYPSTYTSVCLAFNTLCGGPRSQAVDVVVFADDGPGGSPGTELGSVPVTITSLPIFPEPIPAWASFDISSLNIVVNSGSVYIGARWTPDGLPETFLAADENGRGFGGGYYFDNISNVWTPIQAFFPSYRAMFVRAVEQVDGLAVVSTDPAARSVVSTQPSDFIVNVREAVQASTLQASDFAVNGIAANSVDYTPGATTMTFYFTSTPVTTQGAQTMHIAQGAFLSDPAGDPVHEFNGPFYYDVSVLQMNSTVPAVGGTFSPPAPGTYQYDVNWNDALDPSSVQTSDLTLSGVSGATVTGVSVINGNMTTRFILNIPSGGSLTASLAAGAITDQFGNPNNAFSGNYTVTGCPPDQYVITEGTDAIVPGDTDIGNDCDECDTFIPLPFNFQLYGTTYTAVNVSSNGRLDFVNANEPGGFLTGCLPSQPNGTTGLPYDNTIFAAWQDLRTDPAPGCANFPGGVCGVFTSVTGTSPNRIFNIEWRAVLYDDDSQPQNFEVRLYENDPNQRFDVVIGTLTNSRFLAERRWVSGVQGDSNLGLSTEDFCLCPPGLPPLNVSHTYQLTPCAAPSPTPTPTATPTSSPRPTPTPRPTPPARIRPTPHPRP